MVEITVQALDSASAMEEVEKRLGSDALIVSTSRVDGKIEIVATDDEPLKYKKFSEPLLLDDRHRIRNFSDVFDAKIEEANKTEVKKGSKPKQVLLQEGIETIRSELQKLEKQFLEKVETESLINKKTSSDFFKYAGVSTQVIQKLNQNSHEGNFDDMAKKLAKKFVHGKCPNFEDSDLFLIIGPRLSGKSVFSRKLISLLKSKDEIKDCVNLNISKIPDLPKRIRSWATEIDKTKTDGKKVAVAELETAGDTDKLLVELQALKPNLKISVLNTCEVGNSYQNLKRNFPKRRAENEYLVITKLDLCDLSLQEISAFIELNHRCLFFSGMEIESEGLFFAQVEKLKSHIIQLVQSEGN